MSQPDSDVVVAVFVMNGCGACHEFLPRFKRIAQAPQRELGGKSYAHYLRIVIVDAADQRHQALCDQHAIKFTPTVLLLRRPTGVKRWDTALSDPEIDQAFKIAMSGL